MMKPESSASTVVKDDRREITCVVDERWKKEDKKERLLQNFDAVNFFTAKIQSA